MSSRHNVISQCDDIINDIITHTCAAGHVTFWYERGCTQRGVGSVTQDLQEVGPHEARIGSNASGASS